MDELLGFIVLSGPIFLILLCFLITIIVMVIMLKRFSGAKKKMFGVMGIFTVSLILLFGDEIIGKIYLNNLCKSEAGTKVYKPVELPEIFWDSNMQLNIFNKHGFLKRDFWLNNIGRGEGNIEKKLFNIEKSTSKIIYKGNSILLAEIITFRHWGGWLRSNFSLHNSANSCDFISDKSFERNLYTQLFIRPTSKH